jgi:hypothetical protein
VADLRALAGEGDVPSVAGAAGGALCDAGTASGG